MGGGVNGIASAVVVRNHPCRACTNRSAVLLPARLVMAHTGFLSRFEGASCPAKLLEEITIIDTPGVLSGEKQRIERNYNVSQQCVVLNTL